MAAHVCGPPSKSAYELVAHRCGDGRGRPSGLAGVYGADRWCPDSESRAALGRVPARSRRSACRPGRSGAHADGRHRSRRRPAQRAGRGRERRQRPQDPGPDRRRRGVRRRARRRWAGPPPRGCDGRGAQARDRRRSTSAGATRSRSRSAGAGAGAGGRRETPRGCPPARSRSPTGSRAPAHPGAPARSRAPEQAGTAARRAPTARSALRAGGGVAGGGRRRRWTCEIDWKPGYIKSGFRAMAAPPGEERRTPFGESRPIKWTLMGEPEPPTEELVEVVRELVTALTRGRVGADRTRGALVRAALPVGRNTDNRGHSRR